MGCTIFFGWIFFAALVVVAAQSQGRSGCGWFLIAAIISPLLAILLLLIMPAR